MSPLCAGWCWGITAFTARQHRNAVSGAGSCGMLYRRGYIARGIMGEAGALLTRRVAACAHAAMQWPPAAVTLAQLQWRSQRSAQVEAQAVYTK